MSEKARTLGFGFCPAESQHHFLVAMPVKGSSSVIIYERFRWQDEAKQAINIYEDKAKAEISKHKWTLLEEAVRMEFNERLKKKKLPVGRFLTMQTLLGELWGKELLVLVWAVEDCDPANIPQALRNWLGLAPEERWWLYTMTNAATGGIDDHRGWRKALRYALTENPVDENRQQSLFASLIGSDEDKE